eukprot:15278224-Heterocapsa_arctica.AAC.1
MTIVCDRDQHSDLRATLGELAEGHVREHQDALVLQAVLLGVHLDKLELDVRGLLQLLDERLDLAHVVNRRLEEG